MLKMFIHNFGIAVEAMMQNKLRAMLTSLGIICGVASVIAMLSIGKGAEQKILEKMKMLGTNNIIIQPLDKEEIQDKQQEEADETGEQQDITKKKKRFSPGLTLADGKSIREVLPHVSHVTPQVILETMALREGFKKNIKLVGVSSSFFEVNNFDLEQGKLFNKTYDQFSQPVCLIGSGVKTHLFATEDPIGRMVKCGRHWMKVIGVLKEKKISDENIKSLGIRDYNNDVYIPISTMLLRYKNRALVTGQDLRDRSRRRNKQQEDYNQLDKLVITLSDTKYMMTSAEVISRLLYRQHNREVDFEIIVPELLLQQEKQTKQIFNIVLGAIASISLVVGGIGIMNIMLASVMERIKEIGVRLAVGAKQKDILMQFLSEAVAISLSGGLIGILLGFGLSFAIENITDIPTVVTWYSIVVSFLVSISVGIIFGIMPAQRAAGQNPIESLRYE